MPTLTKKDKTYIDISLSFIPSAVTDDLTLLTNERAINNAIKNVVMFLPLEVPFDRDIGSNASKYLFDLVDEPTAGLLASEIERAILYCEPRVTFNQVDPEKLTGAEFRDNAFGTPGDLFLQDDLGVTVEARPDQNEFAVTVKYRIVGAEKIFKVQEILTPTR